MAIGRTHGSAVTEQKLVSNNISNTYSSQQSDMEDEQYTEREERVAAEWDLHARGFEVGHSQEQNWQDTSVKWRNVSLAVQKTIT
jgi:hypothetical protein